MRSMETRRAVIRLPYRTETLCTAHGRRHATTKSRIRLHQHLTGLDQETQKYREMIEESQSLNQPLDHKLPDFDEEKKNTSH